MNKQLSLPMYNVCRRDTQALWSILKPLMVAEGLVAERLDIVWPEGDLMHVWQSEALLLSQTCGYPLVTRLEQVQIVGTFHYSAPGCETFRYRSFLVARAEDEGKQLGDFRGRRVVCNSQDSQSGYNVLRKIITPLFQGERFFGEVIFSGSHRQSLVQVGQGNADIAAIDCITWALLARHQPDLLRCLTIVGQSPLAPGLPLITSKQTKPETLNALRKALIRLVSDPAYHDVCSALYINGFSATNRNDYQMILDWECEAAEKGLFSL